MRFSPTMLACCCIAHVAWAQGPVHRKFSVRRTGEGFVLYGFRAEVGSANRFRLLPGMDAAAVRAQLQSVRWDEFRDDLSDRRARAVAGRRHYGGAAESLEIMLEHPDGLVWQIEYRVEPVPYSRRNLERFLKAAFGEGTPLRDEENRLEILYAGTNPDQGLIVDVQRLGSAKSRWRLGYLLFDRSLRPPATDSVAPALKEAGKLIPIWPLPVGPSTTTQPGGHRVPDVGSPKSGFKQIYPPPASQPTDAS